MQGRRRSFGVGACTDLGAFDPTLPDGGASEFMERTAGVLDEVVLMEDRQPVFFHGYAGFDPAARMPLNRHGPRPHAWTMGDVKRLVDGLHAAGVKVLLGYWIHECDWVDDRHPELLMTTSGGTRWTDRHEQNADFNPMRRMRADPEMDIPEGEVYAAWAARQFNRLADDFGFDGLFLGDGAMGFRRHGEDHRDLRQFDYDPAWLAEFAHSEHAAAHPACALHDASATVARKAHDVRAHHWAGWVEWNCAKWAEYYRTTAEIVHAAGRVVHAYNVMNYDPALARLHGIDYRMIAQAGLDKMVFQCYDHAWGADGPFGWAGIRRKDHATNARAMLLTRAAVGFDTAMKLVFTTETDDSVEGWDCPATSTLGQAFGLGTAQAHDGERWRRAADGTFIVWANAVAPDEWRSLAAAFHAMEQEAATPPLSALVWTDGDEKRLVENALMLVTPEERYAHLDRWPATHYAAANGAIRAADVPKARWDAHPKRVRVHEPKSARPPDASVVKG